MCRGWTAESRERERGGHGFHRLTSFYLDESTRMRSTKPGGGAARAVRPVSPCPYAADAEAASGNRGSGQVKWYAYRVVVFGVWNVVSGASVRDVQAYL